MKLKVWAIRKGTLYRVRLRGSLVDRKGLEIDGTRCPGSVRLTVKSGRRTIASGRAAIDGACGFERKFALRTRRNYSRVEGIAKCGGGPALLAVTRTARARVVRRR